MIIVGNLSSKRFPSHRLRNARAIIGPHQQFHSVNKREGSPKNVIAILALVLFQLVKLKQENRSLSECLSCSLSYNESEWGLSAVQVQRGQRICITWVV